jgi:NADH-quinone oxidoreductase subunit L
LAFVFHAVLTREVPMPTVLLLVPVLPLLTALIVVAGRGAAVRNRVKIAVWPLGAAFCGAVAALYVVTTQGPITARFYDPDLAGSFPVPLGFYVDRLSAVMLVLISAIGTVIYVYSIEYMHGEPHERRYFTLLGITVCVLLCMVTSANLIMLFLFWQILSYLLYLLIHNHTHAATLESAFRTFALLRTGDVAFLAGTALAYTLYGTLEFPELFSAASQSTATITVLPGIECNGTTAVTLAPLFGLSSPALHAAFFIGTLTAVLGASMMLAQNDIKNMLGFSTIGQMGYMIMECGLGAFSLAVFHLIAHGLFKATVFLNCGDVIGKARLEPHFPHPEHETEESSYSRLTWVTGFVTTLLVPLLILLVTHGALRIPLLEAQGAVIFLFFIWITSSQAILTLTRLRAVASWKVSAAMLLTLLFVVFVYLFAVESFTAFLYPNPQEVASYFKAAELPSRLFDMMIGAATLMTVIGWVYVYIRAHGRTLPVPGWIDAIRIRLYVLFLNRLYVDEVLHRLGRVQLAAIRRFDEPAQGRTP